MSSGPKQKRRRVASDSETEDGQHLPETDSSSVGTVDSSFDLFGSQTSEEFADLERSSDTSKPGPSACADTGSSSGSSKCDDPFSESDKTLNPEGEAGRSCTGTEQVPGYSSWFNIVYDEEETEEGQAVIYTYRLLDDMKSGDLTIDV